MIKRFIIALMSVLCFAMPASANIKISPDAMDTAIKKHFSTVKDRASALATYKANLDKDGSFSMANVWKICSAGGLNIKKPAEKSECQAFKTTIIKSSTVRYYEVCGKDKGKVNGLCVTDFKNIQVTMSPAIKLAKEYASIKNGDNVLQCFSKHRTVGFPGQDFVKCVSHNKNIYYEFEFDDVKESFDDTIQWGIQRAVCDLHGAQATLTGICKSDENQCKKINTTMAKFGYSASYKNKVCNINFNLVSKAEDLRTAFGIDNFVFCRGIQVQNAPSAESALKRFIVSAAKEQGKKITESQVTCLAGFNTYTGKGCDVNGFNDFKDDIKTCKVGNEQIDFVFDDINESWDSYHAGGVSGMNCIASDGTFDGQNCRLLGEDNCMQLKRVLKTSCPECDQPVWNGVTCVLPSAKQADKIKKTIKITTEAGVAVAGVALFFVPGAQGGAVLALNYVAGTLVIGGATARVTSNIIMETAIYSDFADEVESCHNEKCARDLLRKWLQKIQSYKREFTKAEQMATDELCNHLFSQIPADSDFWLSFMQDPEVFDPWTCELKTKKQFWQHVRTAGEVAEIAGALLRIGNLAFEKTTETVTKQVIEKAYAFGNSGRPGIMLRATQEGIAKTTGGSFLNKLGLKYSTAYSWADAADILSKAGLDVNLYRGATWFNKSQGLLRLTNGKFASALVKVPITIDGSVTQVTFNMAGMVNPAVGTLAETAAATGYFESRTADGYRVPYCMGNKPLKQGIIEIVDIKEEAKDKNKAGKVVPVVTPTPEPNPTPNPVVTPEPNPVVTPEPNPVVTPEPNPVVTPEPNPGPVTTQPNRPDTFTPDKSKNTGLIVGLTAAGLVATGGIIAGVVATNSKKKAEDTSVDVNLSLDPEMEKVLYVANNVLGTIDGKAITLVSLPTTVNTNAKLVEVDGHAVAVVEYNGYKLPYYINKSKWTPLLGIGEKAHWFNVYPKANTDIKKIDMITDLMNQQINPSVVSRYVGLNARGLSLPVAANSAFDIINAEFPNGVVQNENMTAADAKLYSDNYNLIQRKLK